jgi:hypothetical protein
MDCEGIMCTEWIVHYPYDEEDTDTHSFNRPYSTHVISIPIERNPGFYLYNVVVLMFVLGTVGLGTFNMKDSETHYRADLLLTLILTLIALKLVTNENMPQVKHHNGNPHTIISVSGMRVHTN